MSLFKDEIQRALTFAPIDDYARASHPGMAHFAGTGPWIKLSRMQPLASRWIKRLSFKNRQVSRAD